MRQTGDKQKEGTRERALFLIIPAKNDRTYFEKLATASASELKTSKTVISLVICKTSWNLLPRWQRRSPAPWDFALWWAATSVPSPALSIKVMLSIFRTIF